MPLLTEGSRILAVVMGLFPPEEGHIYRCGIQTIALQIGAMFRLNDANKSDLLSRFRLKGVYCGLEPALEYLFLLGLVLLRV
jgi:hypothetical protein